MDRKKGGGGHFTLSTLHLCQLFVQHCQGMGGVQEVDDHHPRAATHPFHTRPAGKPQDARFPTMVTFLAAQ